MIVYVVNTVSCRGATWAGQLIQQCQQTFKNIVITGTALMVVQPGFNNTFYDNLKHTK